MPELLTTTAGFFPTWSAGSPTDPVAIQRRAGLDRLVTGNRGWTRWLAEPLQQASGVSRVPAAEVGPDHLLGFVRTGPLRPSGILRTNGGITSSVFQVVLPGPYTLAGMLDDPHARHPIDTLEAVGDWLRAEVDDVPPHRTAMLLEPGLCYRPPSDEIAERLPDVLDRVVAPLSDPILYPWGGPLSAKAYAHVLDADIHAMGFDLAGDPDGTADLIAEFGTIDAVALGCLDVDAGVGLAAPVITDRVNALLARTRASVDRVYVLPNQPLARLPTGSIEPMLTELGAVDRWIADD